ncbi:hypothetical protein ACS5PM_12190 [Ideonella sp. YS5]
MLLGHAAKPEAEHLKYATARKVFHAERFYAENGAMAHNPAPDPEPGDSRLAVAEGKLQVPDCIVEHGAEVACLFAGQEPELPAFLDEFPEGAPLPMYVNSPRTPSLHGLIVRDPARGMYVGSVVGFPHVEVEGLLLDDVQAKLEVLVASGEIKPTVEFVAVLPLDPRAWRR